MTTELKPCPFCGSAAVLVDEDGTYWVRCVACCASAQVSSFPDRAVEAWNQRAVDGRIAELEGLLVEEQQARASWAQRALKAEQERDALTSATISLTTTGDIEAELDEVHRLRRRLDEAIEWGAALLKEVQDCCLGAALERGWMPEKGADGWRDAITHLVERGDELRDERNDLRDALLEEQEKARAELSRCTDALTVVGVRLEKAERERDEALATIAMSGQKTLYLQFRKNADACANERDQLREANKRLRDEYEVALRERDEAALEADRALHPIGRCGCWGEGFCQWCRLMETTEQRDALDFELIAIEDALVDAYRDVGFARTGSRVDDVRQLGDGVRRAMVLLEKAFAGHANAVVLDATRPAVSITNSDPAPIDDDGEAG
jgi:uncharacterized coiled-coil DUF342 family protein